MADSMVGSWKTKPALSSTAGTTRALPRTSLRELAEHRLQGERGRRQDRRAGPGPCPSTWVTSAFVSGCGAGQVHRPAEVVLLEQELQRAHLVAQGDPRPVLLAGAEPAADAELEQREHAGPGAAGRRRRPARCGDGRRGCRRLAAGPAAASQARTTSARKPVPAGAVSSTMRSPGVAVPADGRRRDTSTRGLGSSASIAVDDGVRAVDAAVEDLALVVVGPPVVADAGAGQVDDALDPASAARSTVPALGSQVTSSGAAAGRRTSRTTSWPTERRWGTRAVPMSPDAPVTATLMALASRVAVPAHLSIRRVAGRGRAACRRAQPATQRWARGRARASNAASSRRALMRPGSARRRRRRRGGGRR